MGKSHFKPNRLKNPVRKQKNRDERHNVKQIIKEGKFEELDDYEEIEYSGEMNAEPPQTIKKNIKKEKDNFKDLQ